MAATGALFLYHVQVERICIYAFILMSELKTMFVHQACFSSRITEPVCFINTTHVSPHQRLIILNVFVVGP